MLPELMSEFYTTEDILKLKLGSIWLNSNSQPEPKGKGGKKMNYNTK